MLNPDFEAKDNYNKAAHDVAYLKRLDEYALNRVLEYAGTTVTSERVRLAVFLMDSLPDREYPEQYPNGSEVEYWLSKDRVYLQCQEVIKAIKIIKNPVAVASETQETSLIKAKTKRDRAKNTALEIIPYFKHELEYAAQSQVGQQKSKPVDEIVREAVNIVLRVKKRGERSITRYLKDLDINTTALEYGRQIVRQKLQNKPL